MTEFQILYWHDIPLQVRAGSRRDRVSFELPSRFQDAVDQAAMAAGLTGTDDYLDGFFWTEIQDRDGDAEEVAVTIVSELESSFSRIDWRKTAQAIMAKKTGKEIG